MVDFLAEDVEGGKRINVVIMLGCEVVIKSKAS